MFRAIRVRYKNFLATGNTPIDIQLDEHRSTLIVGKNGNGKTTIPEAITYALFGRTLRNINKSQIVNSVNNGACLVELWFQKNGVDYYIKRGMKPNILECHKAGQLIPAPSSVIEYQTIIEEDVVGLSFKNFTQIIILGFASYTPFMRMTAGARRELIESLLDIEIFSIMNNLIKDDMSSLKNLIETNSVKITSIREQLILAETFSEQLLNQHRQRITESESKILSLKGQIQTSRNTASQLQEQLSNMSTVQSDFDALRRDIDGYLRMVSRIETEQKRLQKDKMFYATQLSCPTCTMPIEESFRDGKIHDIDVKLQQAEAAITQCQEKISEAEPRQQALELRVQERYRLTAEQQTLQTSMKQLSQQLRDLESLHEKLVNTVPTLPNVDVEQLRTQFVTLDTDRKVLHERKLIVDAAQAIFKDAGIKTRIVNSYLATINRLINQYLVALDFPIQLTLDDEFKEHIHSHHRGEFSYENFSDGEKKRIDIALLLTWREIARLKNSAHANLLILDEVLDSSVDTNGTELLVKLLQQLEKDVHIMVISHKTDILMDKFSHIIQIEKYRGFSQIKKDS